MGTEYGNEVGGTQTDQRRNFASFMDYQNWIWEGTANLKINLLTPLSDRKTILP